MAKLEGRDLHIGPKWLRLTPLKASREDQDALEYLLELWPGANNATLTRKFSVEGWQMQHDDLWLLARAFTEAPKLIEASLPLDLWRTGRGSIAYLYKSASWIRVVLWGNKPQQQIAAQFFVEEGDPDIFRSFALLTPVEEARLFGMELEKEIIEASPHWAAENDLVPPDVR